MRSFITPFLITYIFFINLSAKEGIGLEQINSRETSTIKVVRVKYVPDYHPRGHDAFLYAIAYYESRNNYSTVNKWGYLGKYQFHPTTLESIGIKTTPPEFLKDNALQEKAMQTLLERNKKSLRKFIKLYDRKYVGGVYVTESGILAAAHLGGAGNVKKWFRTREDFKDGLGTSITSYMEIFSGYKLDVN